MQHFESFRIQPGDSLSLLDDLGQITTNHGFSIARRAFNFVESLCVYDSLGKHMFWLAPWEGNWILCLPGPTFFQFSENGEIEKALITLLQTNKCDGGIAKMHSVLKELNFKEISQLDWGVAVRSKLSIEYAKRGWHELTDNEQDHVWPEYSQRFGSLDEIQSRRSDVMTWDIRSWLTLSEESVDLKSLVNEVDRTCLRAMRCIGRGVWLALDFNHTCYRVDTQRVPDEFEPWPIRVFPSDCEPYFIDEDFGCGIATTLRCMIGVFGQPFLDLIKEDLRELLTKRS
jgi:hypothetical protein